MVKIRLPALGSQRAKYVAGLACALACAALYLLPNRLHGAPIRLPLTALDAMIPFWPATGWTYASAYFLLLWAFIGLEDLQRASRLLYTFIFVQITATLVFVFFPVVYPRELAVLPPGTLPLNAAVVRFWQGIDAPANCLPSLHVTTSLLLLAAFQSGRLRRFLPLAGMIASLSIASTLTFKQHYVVDLAAGFVVSAIAYFMFFRWPLLDLRTSDGVPADSAARLADGDGG